MCFFNKDGAYLWTSVWNTCKYVRICTIATFHSVALSMSTLSKPVAHLYHRYYFYVIILIVILRTIRECNRREQTDKKKIIKIMFVLDFFSLFNVQRRNKLKLLVSSGAGRRVTAGLSAAHTSLCSGMVNWPLPSFLVSRLFVIVVVVMEHFLFRAGLERTPRLGGPEH